MAGKEESDADVGAPYHEKVEFGTLKRLEFRARGMVPGGAMGLRIRYGAFEEGHHDLR